MRRVLLGKCLKSNKASFYRQGSEVKTGSREIRTSAYFRLTRGNQELSARLQVADSSA